MTAPYGPDNPASPSSPASSFDMLSLQSSTASLASTGHLSSAAPESPAALDLDTAMDMLSLYDSVSSPHHSGRPSLADSDDFEHIVLASSLAPSIRTISSASSYTSDWQSAFDSPLASPSQALFQQLHMPTPAAVTEATHAPAPAPAPAPASAPATMPPASADSNAALAQSQDSKQLRKRELRRAKRARRRARRAQANAAGTDESASDWATGTTESDASVLSDDSAATATPRATPAEVSSILSASDARETINSFLHNPENHIEDDGNKLRLWQAFCIELGLVDPDDALPALNFNGPNSRTSSRASTPRPRRPTLPKTLTQARRLLKEQGHVNLVEYLNARNTPACTDEDGAGAANPSEVGDLWGRYSHLVHPSAAAMIKTTRKTRSFLSLSIAKLEGLEPLLKDFGFRRSRAA